MKLGINTKKGKYKLKYIIMEQQFTGEITEIREPRFGTTDRGDWANAEFEVTEINPQNEDYPQVALFDFFKNGEHVKYAKDFNTYYKLGDIVKVDYNFKKNEYTNKEGKLVSFYKASAWKVEKQGNAQPNNSTSQTSTNELNEEEHDDLPF